MRKTYGNTWWGKQWLNALSEIDYSNRLPRGRTYANKGLARDIKIKKNKITALVQGSSDLPYKVRFTIPEFSQTDKDSLLSIISENPIYLSKLLNRNLPPELKELSSRKGIKIFPDAWRDIQGSCSCPDHAVPCKHMAAVLYLLANEIDKNPFLVFELHDFDLFEALANTGHTSEGQKTVSITRLDALWKEYDQDIQIKEWDEEIFQQLDFTQIPDCREGLLKIISEKPVFYPRGDFKKILGLAYAAVSRKIRTKQYPETSETEDSLFDKIEYVEILLDEVGDFLNINFRDHKEESLLSFDNQADTFTWLEKVPLVKFNNFSSNFKSLILAHQFAKKLLERSAFIPQILEVAQDTCRIRWLPALLNSVVKSLFDGVSAILSRDILFYKKGKSIKSPLEKDNVLALLSFFMNYLIKESHGLDYRYAEDEIGHLFFNGAVLAFQGYENKDYHTTIQLWLNTYYIAEKEYLPVFLFDEDEAQGFWFNLAIQDRKNKIKSPIHLQDVLELKKYASIRMPVLQDLAVLSEYFPLINDVVALQGTQDMFIDPQDFADVLFKILPTIRLFGIKVLLPKSIQKIARPQLSMAISSKEEAGVIQKKSILGLNAMLDFEWQIALGDKLVSQTEFLKMLQKYSGIVRLQDQYVFFDENEIQRLINNLNNPPKLPPNELIHIALSEEYNGAIIKLDKATQNLIQSLLGTGEISPPKGLRATLRPYQRNGFSWLYKNARIGLGSLIADDMGLGKTLQVITTLLKLKEEGILEDQKAIIIVPTTLLTNWVKEIEKFAPDLIPFVYHGSNRNIEGLEKADILLTTYGLARSEASRLSKYKWLVIAIDEAQNIKNPSTAQTKAIKKIKAPIKIAMSGTPVENRLSEYWSIFDFSNAGYLSSLKKFKETFARPIEADRDQRKLKKFRKITEPFILRRLKSDKSIIKDLPDKIEKDQFCLLTTQQTALYQNVINTTMEAIEKAEGIARKGLVLKLLTALKQVCNHPVQFLKTGLADPGLSGKTSLLLDLLGPILEAGEKTLIFTQYQEMGDLLKEMLAKTFNLEIPFLHGGVSRKGRDAMVENFQNNRSTRIMILSLKAGGTGLNLTAANNVIHYDLWWNPAVEAQATDRAYRIGQKRNVMVYRFITEGTFEEKINEMLKEKKELANLTVSTGEKWIGELSNREIKQLVKLG